MSEKSFLAEEEKGYKSPARRTSRQSQHLALGKEGATTSSLGALCHGLVPLGTLAPPGWPCPTSPQPPTRGTGKGPWEDGPLPLKVPLLLTKGSQDTAPGSLVTAGMTETDSGAEA